MINFAVFFCFFFKQKTAYEMRISDWSSDVCSSDLGDMLVGPTISPRWIVRASWICSSSPDPLMRTAIFQMTSGIDPERNAQAMVQAIHTSSEERRVGKEGVSTCRSRWSPCHSKKKK